MKISMRTLNWLIIEYCSIILILSVVAIDGSNTLNTSKILGIRSDYLLHMFLFIPWMVMSKWRWKGSTINIIFWLTLGVGIVVAGISEAVQIFLPYRTFNAIDLAANTLGIVVGALIAGWGRGAKCRAIGEE